MRAAAPAGPDLQGLRDKIDHMIVIFQENRSFDHYFGAYQPPGGPRWQICWTPKGKSTRALPGCKRTPPGCLTATLPVPYQLPGFAHALLDNQPFKLTRYIPPDANVPWNSSHHFFRMAAQIDHGKMDRFVALALPGKHQFRDKAPDTDPVAMMLAQSTSSGCHLGFYTRGRICPIYHHLADEYVLFDHFFQAMTGGSTGNALYLAAARSAPASAASGGRYRQPDPAGLRPALRQERCFDQRSWRR